MPRTSSRRHKGCLLCKPHKFAQQGDAERQGRPLQVGFGRHSRINRHEIPEDEILDAEDLVRRAPTPKDTIRWCRGKVGREHTPTVVARPWHPDRNSCAWRPIWSPRQRKTVLTWDCVHREECAGCGRVLTPRPWLPPTRCPDYQAQVAKDS